MKVDLIIKGAFVFQTAQRKFSKKNVCVHEGKIYCVSSEEIEQITAYQTIVAENQFLIPGFIDSHMHIESSMTTPELFSDWALRYGVTTVVADAHEIANVFGLDGIRRFFDVETELDIFQAIPSSVPSTRPELETTGGYIGVDEVKEMLTWPKMICLGEAMDFKGIAYDSESLIRQIIKICKETKPTMPLEGHIPKIYGQELADFLASGITSDHTHQFPEHLLEKIEAGLFIQFQSKSITKETMQKINDDQLYEFACFVTDDVMADDLLHGHLNQNVTAAIQQGLAPEQAIYMTTYTPARRMGLHDRGSISPGKVADFLLLDSLNDLTINSVYKNGKKVYPRNQVAKEKNQRTFPDAYYHSVKGRAFTKEDFVVRVSSEKEKVRCRAITKEKIGTFTEMEVVSFPVKDASLQIDFQHYCLLVVQERYGKNGNISRSLIKQSFTKKGAIATTWAHDHHNVMIMANEEESFLIAQKRLHELQGGYVVVHEGKVVAQCPLPLAGILSQEPLEKVGESLQAVREAMQQLGYENQNEIMSFSTLSLPVSPSFKVTDVGLMDTKKQVVLPLIFEEDGRVIYNEAIN